MLVLSDKNEIGQQLVFSLFVFLVNLRNIWSFCYCTIFSDNQPCCIQMRYVHLNDISVNSIVFALIGPSHRNYPTNSYLLRKWTGNRRQCRRYEQKTPKLTITQNIYLFWFCSTELSEFMEMDMGRSRSQWVEISWLW